MRKFCMPEITQTALVVFSLSIFFFLASRPAQAQYYLADSKHDSSSEVYQNVEYTYFSGVAPGAEESTSGASEESMNGVVTMFLSIAGACVGLPLLAMCGLRILLGNGVRSARMRQNHFSDLYLDAPPQPLRWYDPRIKSFLETAGK